MADSVAHGRTVLSAVVGGGGSIKALESLMEHLLPEHFTDTSQRVMFQLLIRYLDQTGGILTRDQLDDLLRDKKAGTRQLYGEVYDSLAAAAPEEHAFRHSVLQLRELASERATGEALTLGMQILRDSLLTEDGEDLAGHAAAREYVMRLFAEADLLAGASDSPGGNVVTETDEVMAAYAKAKAVRMSGKPVGVQFGIPALDDYLGGGLANGLCLVVAGTTVGKSSLCAQLAWYNAVAEGRSVLVFTTEQHRDEVRIKIVSRHSRLPKFGLERGLDSAKIRSGWLSREEEHAMAAVLSDLKGGGYGELQVIQMPEHCTVGVMTARAESMARRSRPDVVVADYLQLFDPVKPRRDAAEHENQGGIVKTAHRWGQTAFHGIGVPVISPWQANRGGAAALRSGDFSLDEHMSQTKEAANTAGTVLSLALREEDTSNGRAVPLKLVVEKNRDGAHGGKFPVTADYATSWFADRNEADAAGTDDFFELDPASDAA